MRESRASQSIDCAASRAPCVLRSSARRPCGPFLAVDRVAVEPFRTRSQFWPSLTASPPPIAPSVALALFVVCVVVLAVRHGRERWWSGVVVVMGRHGLERWCCRTRGALWPRTCMVAYVVVAVLCGHKW